MSLCHGRPPPSPVPSYVQFRDLLPQPLGPCDGLAAPGHSGRAYGKSGTKVYGRELRSRAWIAGEPTTIAEDTAWHHLSQRQQATTDDAGGLLLEICLLLFTL
jgi:hypothetical protein